jgi:predicted unusual protein kinase regulating ubiquinone biosynthesis (AarF/ABC1/UbiB family)
MGPAFVRRRMAAELGPGWSAKFASFDLQPAAAASLGQVHRATSLDGRPLAIKLQYPEMQSAVESDLAQMRALMAMGRQLFGAVDTREIASEITDRIREELDYEREGRAMALYRRFFEERVDIAAPQLFAELSTGRLLTMEWLEGRGLTSFLGEDEEARNRIARLLFEAWWTPLIRIGVIHGDPHLGNYTIRPDGSVNLLDYGCVRIFGAKFVQGVIDLYHALERDDRALAIHAYESWGFKNLNKETIDVLNRWAGFVYGPLLEDRSRRIQENSSGVYGREVAEGVHADLRRLGPVKPPREFVFMDRAAIGLGSVFLHLGAEINWHRMFKELIRDFDVAALDRRQKKLMKQVGLAPTG